MKDTAFYLLVAIISTIYYCLFSEPPKDDTEYYYINGIRVPDDYADDL